MTMGRGIWMLAVASAAALACASAQAADLSPGGYKDGPAPAVASWGGYYVGVNAGGGYSPDQVLGYGATSYPGLTPAGVFGGGQIGYNWQLPASFSPYGGYGSVVYGLEADLQGAGWSDSGVNEATSPNSSFKSELDYFGTVRARLGYASDKTLYYVTGGFAYGGVKQSATIGKTAYSFDSTATGYAVGGGL